MKKALLIFVLMLSVLFAAEGRRPHFSRRDLSPRLIISDTVVYKVDSTGAFLLGPDSLKIESITGPHFAPTSSNTRVKKVSLWEELINRP